MLATQILAPDFTLKNQDGKDVQLSSFKGNQNVVLIFYPFDFSPVCSDEISVFSQAKPLFDAQNAVMLGISCDSFFCHKAFSDSRHLKMDLLTDFEPKGAISKLYGVYDDKLGCSQRALFVIDKNQSIQWNYLSPIGENPGADGALTALQKLNK